MFTSQRSSRYVSYFIHFKDSSTDIPSSIIVDYDGINFTNIEEPESARRNST